MSIVVHCRSKSKDWTSSYSRQMATSKESALCSNCNKRPPKRFCVRCETHFCSNDFKEHEQQLSVQFNNEIVRVHGELLERLRKLEKPNESLSGLFDQIDEWKKTSIKKIEDAAEKAMHELNELINKRKAAITKQLEDITQEIQNHCEEKKFSEIDIVRLRTKLGELQHEIEQHVQEDTKPLIVVENGEIDWNKLIYIGNKQLNSLVPRNLPISTSTTWNQNGITVAGGNGYGNALNQLYVPCGICIDDNQTLYIAECLNHRVIEWKSGAMTGRVVAGGNGPDSGTNQLETPFDLLIDREQNSLIISDRGNKRVVRWPLHDGTQGETIISNIDCWGLAMGKNRFLYIADFDSHSVKRYRIGENKGTIVAGGNGPGNGLHQLDHPRYIFVDEEDSIYVSDFYNHRVVKWIKGAKEGIIVAGGQGQGDSLEQLSLPAGIFVDNADTLYVADQQNYRIMRWPKDATIGSVILGGNGAGNKPNQFWSPFYLAFDRESNIYVSDYNNHRVQMFKVNRL